VLFICLAGCATRGPALAATSAAAPASGEGQTFWVYRDGHFNWKGDYSFLADIDYHDRKGVENGHSPVIAVKITGKWGGFQPFAAGAHFDVSHYKYLVYSLKPTVDGQVFATGFAADNDVADGKVVTVTGAPYGPAPLAGKWATYKIPLSDFALTNHFILKFTIADGTGRDTNLFYVDDVGFTNE
jgi:hypothetical protein